MLGLMPAKHDGQMTDNEKVDDWCRYIKALCLQDSKLQALAHLEKGVRAEVMKKLGMKTAEDVFTLCAERKDRRE